MTFHQIRCLILLILFSIVNSIHSCDCNGGYVDLPIKEMGLGLENSVIKKIDAEIIFEGILISIKHDSTKRIKDYALLFEVTDVYKGECIDTITVWTNHTGGGCGFRAKIGTYSIVVAAKDDMDQTLYTFRADCWGGASYYLKPRRFSILRDFLIAITYRIDGTYSFDQLKFYWSDNESDQSFTKCLEFSIVDQKLSGAWNVFDKSNNIIEKGKYKNGERIETWKYKSVSSNYNSELQELHY